MLAAKLAPRGPLIPLRPKMFDIPALQWAVIGWRPVRDAVCMSVCVCEFLFLGIVRTRQHNKDLTSKLSSLAWEAVLGVFHQAEGLKGDEVE